MLFGDVVTNPNANLYRLAYLLYQLNSNPADGNCAHRIRDREHVNSQTFTIRTTCYKSDNPYNHRYIHNNSQTIGFVSLSAFPQHLKAPPGPSCIHNASTNNKGKRPKPAQQHNPDAANLYNQRRDTNLHSNDQDSLIGKITHPNNHRRHNILPITPTVSNDYLSTLRGFLRSRYWCKYTH